MKIYVFYEDSAQYFQFEQKSRLAGRGQGPCSRNVTETFFIITIQATRKLLIFINDTYMNRRKPSCKRGVRQDRNANLSEFKISFHKRMYFYIFLIFCEFFLDHLYDESNSSRQEWKHSSCAGTFFLLCADGNVRRVNYL